MLCDRVFTLFEREESLDEPQGRLGSEPRRVHEVVQAMTDHSVVVMNETFSSTNEAEGSQIAFDVVKGLASSGVQLRCVTHMYEFARRLSEGPEARAVFLRAPRSTSGGRSYRLVPGEPLRTSFALDLFDEVFGSRVTGSSGTG